MAVMLDHTIIHSADRETAASFLSDILGLPAPEPFGPFLVVRAGNGVSLDFMAAPEPVACQHYAFRVSEEEFDAIFGRIEQRGLSYWADPHRSQPGRINHYNGGRGVYFQDPSGHLLEILTRP